MIVAIHQPQYLPWLGYFDKMLKADVFCYLDTVQYKKNEWQNRNRIKTAQGWQWLTVPVTLPLSRRRSARSASTTRTNWSAQASAGPRHQLPPRAAFRAVPFPCSRRSTRRRWESHRRAEPGT
ncbi:MAG: WbqC family protein [Desulfobacterales bacterium]|nr:WbqC family protein [Desulfobacterales bacterium]